MGTDRSRGRGNTLQEIANSRTAKASAAVKPKKKKASIAATWILTLLGLFVVGTFIVLSTVRHYFGTHTEDFISLEEIQPFRRQEASLPYEPNLPLDQVAEEQRKGLHREKIPRIIHQTWKTDILPERWVAVREACIKLLPDYEFKLWSDESAREFIKANYTSFLPTWDSYSESHRSTDFGSSV
jgi:mannosyltransferase OCH1-like enzyme